MIVSYSEPGASCKKQRIITSKLLDQYSRTMGAFGGKGIWLNVISKRYAVIGVGRTGSIIAYTLAKYGVDDIILIDADTIEEHNLDMHGVIEDDIDHYKVEAVGKSLRKINNSVNIKTITKSCTDQEAVMAIKTADIIILAVDDEKARMSGAIVASLFLKPLLDIGTGIHFERNGNTEDDLRRIMGADVRLVIPGNGCLLCVGGLDNHRFLAKQIVKNVKVDVPWYFQKSGSLITLNNIATGIGLQMLIDYLSRRFVKSVWCQLQIKENGFTEISYPDFSSGFLSPGEKCHLCENTGKGDDLLGV